MICKFCRRDMNDERGCSCTHIKFEPQEGSVASLGRNNSDHPTIRQIRDIVINYLPNI